MCNWVLAFSGFLTYIIPTGPDPDINLHDTTTEYSVVMSVLGHMYSMPGTELVYIGVNVHTFRRRITTHHCISWH
jgi:hypothetical protein